MSAFKSSIDTENIRWVGWRSYLLLALLAVTILMSTWFASSITTPKNAQWFPALLVGTVILFGFAIIWGVTQMRKELTDHLGMETALRQASIFR
ncbi:MAG: hypothetical protein LBI68_02555, partial [Azoarcus sp.]|nr:hypothetical protein [Azoarcus sp.]